MQKRKKNKKKPTTKHRVRRKNETQVLQQLKKNLVHYIKTNIKKSHHVNCRRRI
jgi:hypothetical protein